METPPNILPLDYGKPRLGDWIQTYTGRKFHLLDPRPGDFDIRDIAHALSNQCRFAGHTRRFYSVAEHSVRVADLVCTRLLGCDVKSWFPNKLVSLGDQLRVYSGLMHDASDAYMLDMPRPFKYLPEFEVYRDLEHELMRIMAHDFQFKYPKPAIVNWADNVLLGTEARDQFDNPIGDWHKAYEHLPHRIRPWSPRKAERRFLDTYYRLNPFGIQKPSFWSFGPKISRHFPWRGAA